MLAHLIKSAVTLFVVIDPIGTVPLFLIAAKAYSPKEQQRIAFKAVIISAAILIFFITVGQLLFDHLGIGLQAFRVAGGIVLLLVSLRMILSAEIEATPGESIAAAVKKDIAVFPLAMPFIAGPGSIVAAVLLTDNDIYSFAEQMAVTLVMLGILLVVWLVLCLASRVQKILGETGINVVTRIMGMILAALSVQTILEGLKGFFFG